MNSLFSESSLFFLQKEGRKERKKRKEGNKVTRKERVLAYFLVQLVLLFDL